jgi:hypothetical protein
MELFMKKNFLFVCALTCLGTQVLAQNFIHKSKNISSHAIYLRTMDVKAVDLNKDGYLDLVLAVEWAPNAILWGSKDGNFNENPAMKLSPNMYDSEDVAIADFDKDGWLDLVFAAEDDMNHEFYFNRGKNGFVEVKDKFPKFISNAVIAHDFNEDGHVDLIFGNQGQNRIFINDGKANFTEETNLRLPNEEKITQDIALLDVDGDGDMDLIIGNEDGNQLWINQGKGIFKDETSSRFPSGEMETRKVIVIDVNKDGFKDVFLCNVDSPEKNPKPDKLYLNDGKGNFKDVSETHLPNQNIDTLDAVVIDVNLDGYMDLVLAQMVRVQPSVLLNDGSGKFKLTDNILPKVPGNYISIISADFDKNGSQDIYLGGFMSDDKLLLRK